MGRELQFPPQLPDIVQSYMTSLEEIISKAKASIDKDLQRGVDKGKLIADAKEQILNRINFCADF